jgi:hypothetical protein
MADMAGLSARLALPPRASNRARRAAWILPRRRSGRAWGDRRGDMDATRRKIASIGS